MDRKFKIKGKENIEYIMKGYGFISSVADPDNFATDPDPDPDLAWIWPLIEKFYMFFG